MIDYDNNRNSLTSYKVTHTIPKLGFMRLVIFRLVYILLAIFLVAIGTTLVFASSSDFLKSNKVNSQNTQSQPEVKVNPVKIYIPKLERSLNISEGYIVDGRWTVSETGVSYLIKSATPGEAGNSVIYGHNKAEILGKLWKVEKGDLVYVVLSNGSIVKYEIFEEKEVKPSQIEILNNVGDSRLTIYTCSGFLDSARFVVVGRLI